MPPKEISPAFVALGFIVLAVIGGSIIVWGLIVARLAKGEPIAPYEPRRPIPRRGIDIMMAVLVCLIVALIARLIYVNVAPALAVGPAAPPREIGPIDLAANLGFELIVIGFLLGGMKAIAGATWKDLGFSLSRFGSDLVLGVCGYLAAILPISLLQWWLGHYEKYTHPILEGYKHRPDPMMLAATAVSAVLAAPFVEELFFRVLLQGWFESLEAARQERRRKATELENPPPAVALLASDAEQPVPYRADIVAAAENPYAAPQAVMVAEATPVAEVVPESGPSWWPILLSSALFALCHFGQGLAPVSLFFLAIALGWLYQRTHRLWPSLVVHMLLNGGSIAVLWLTVGGGGLPVAK